MARTIEELLTILEDVTTPEVTIGGVPIISQEFRWSRPSGPAPYVYRFRVPKGELQTQMLALQNPVDLVIKIRGGITNKEIKDHVIEYKNLYLHDPRDISEFEVMWQISDVRWLLRGKKFYFKYNVTRQRNEITSTVTAPSTDPAIIRAPYDVFKEGRYLTPSVKFDGSPLKIKEIIEAELFKVGIFPKPDVSGDGDYIIENVRVDGGDSYQTLANLLSKSRLNMNVTRAGEIYVYSIDFFDETILGIARLVEIQIQEKVRPGTLYVQQLGRIRPKNIRVRFECKHEVLVKDYPISLSQIVNLTGNQRATEPQATLAPLSVNTVDVITQSNIDNNQVISCVNVVRVPFVPATLNFFQSLDVGEYVPLVFYLAEFGFLEEELRKLWWTNSFEHALSRQIQNGIRTIEIDQIASKIAAEIRASYRQLYMIDPFFLDRIDFWENKRAAIINNFSGFRSPSPLFSDFATVPRARHPEQAKSRGLYTQGIHNWIVNVQDPKRENATAGTISIVSQDLGVFKINYSTDIDAVIDQIIPSAVDNPPVASPGGITNLSRFQLDQNSPLAAEHTMETLFTVKWMFDPKTDSVDNEKLFFDINFNYETVSGGAKGPDIDILSRKEYARFDRNGNLLNRGILEAIAQSESAAAFNQFIDRTVGFVAIPGDFDVDPNGNMKSITTVVSPQDGLYTEIDMMEIPFAPELEQSLPADVRAYVMKQLDRGGP